MNCHPRCRQPKTTVTTRHKPKFRRSVAAGRANTNGSTYLVPSARRDGRACGSPDTARPTTLHFTLRPLSVGGHFSGPEPLHFRVVIHSNAPAFSDHARNQKSFSAQLGSEIGSEICSLPRPLLSKTSFLGSESSDIPL